MTLGCRFSKHLGGFKNRKGRIVNHSKSLVNSCCCLVSFCPGDSSSAKSAIGSNCSLQFIVAHHGEHLQFDVVFAHHWQIIFRTAFPMGFP